MCRVIQSENGVFFAGTASSLSPAVRTERTVWGWPSGRSCRTPVHLPQLHRPVATATDDTLAIGADGDRLDGIHVPLERMRFGQGFGVPHPDHVIRASGDDAFAVGADGHVRDPTGSSLEGAEFNGLLDIPCGHRTRAIAADDPLAIPADGHGADVGSRLERKDLGPTDCVPDLDLSGENAAPFIGTATGC